MEITLGTRTADTVRIYFEKSQHPEIKKFLPQKAQSVEEALEDYEKTLLPDTTSYGRTILADGHYVGDICMVSFCIFEASYRSKGIATTALNMFLALIREKYGVNTVGAFTFSHNHASLNVLQKNGFSIIEEFEEDGVLSKYLQYSY